MNEKEVMNLLNSIDDDLVDQKIDCLLQKKGENVDMESIKEKAMNKLSERTRKKPGINKKPIIAAALVATLAVSTVYAGDISNAVKSIFTKSMVYSTIVDGDAFYLPEEIKLNDKFTLLNIRVSEESVIATLKSAEQLGDEIIEGLNTSIIPANDTDSVYTVGGYGTAENNEILLRFINGAKNNITPFKDFKLMIGSESFDISLEKAETVKADENLVIGTSEIAAGSVVASVVGSAQAADGKTNIQLIAGFDDPDLKLSVFGAPTLAEFEHSFINNDTGVMSSGNGSMTEPIIAYDQNNNAYTLGIPKDAVGYPVTTFETDAKPGTRLNVKVPAIAAYYQKDIEKFSFSIPADGEVVIDQELDFIIQKAVIKTIKRTSETTAAVTFELNTGGDNAVSIMDIGAYSSDVTKADTTISGGTATIEMTFDKDVKEADFSFTWPRFIIVGNWSIDLGEIY